MSNEYEEVLDRIIEPLINKAMELFEPLKPLQPEVCKRSELYNLFIASVLEGVKLSEETNKEIDAKNKEIISTMNETEIERNMKIQSDVADKTSRLNVKQNTPDGKPRFVNPLDINPETGELK